MVLAAQTEVEPPPPLSLMLRKQLGTDWPKTPLLYMTEQAMPQEWAEPRECHNRGGAYPINNQKLKLKWSGPYVFVRHVNSAMVEVGQIVSKKGG